MHEEGCSVLALKFQWRRVLREWPIVGRNGMISGRRQLDRHWELEAQPVEDCAWNQFSIDFNTPLISPVVGFEHPLPLAHQLECV